MVFLGVYWSKFILDNFGFKVGGFKLLLLLVLSIDKCSFLLNLFSLSWAFKLKSLESFSEKSSFFFLEEISLSDKFSSSIDS